MSTFCQELGPLANTTWTTVFGHTPLLRIDMQLSVALCCAHATDEGTSMSVRFPFDQQVQLSRCGSSTGDAEVGSLFGKPLDCNLWERLAGSPVIRATTPSEVPSLHFERAESVDDGMDIDMSEMSIDGPTPAGNVTLDSVVHTHELPAEFAYAYFERDTGTAQLRAPNGHVVSNSNPVVPRVVHADALAWQPVLSSDGHMGHKFLLLHGGTVQAHVEAFLESDTIGASLNRVLVVHGLYSTLAHTAKLVDRHSLLEFNSVESHVQRLYTTMSSIEEDAMYLPVAELLIGSTLAPSSPTRLHAVVPTAYQAHPQAPLAAHVWERTTQQLSQLSNLVTNCINQHNMHEFTRSHVMY